MGQLFKAPTSPPPENLQMGLPFPASCLWLQGDHRARNQRRPNTHTRTHAGRAPTVEGTVESRAFPGRHPSLAPRLMG